MRWRFVAKRLGDSQSRPHSGAQPSGGMTLMMPYASASSRICSRYAMGSRNSSRVGLNSGASKMGCVNRVGRVLRMRSCSSNRFASMASQSGSSSSPTSSSARASSSTSSNPAGEPSVRRRLASDVSSMAATPNAFVVSRALLGLTHAAETRRYRPRGLLKSQAPSLRAASRCPRPPCQAFPSHDQGGSRRRSTSGGPEIEAPQP
mmetsp:Transcript_28143/g.87078  ORF Transcript_28143/g.87078 Transcript_28143/m.87078 type:complete len:205 (+) Transcript_28143:1467-2081(+)